MENFSCNKKFKNGGRFQMWWERRSKFENQLSVSLITVITILIIFSLSLVLIYAGSTKVCDSSGCLQAAAQIVSYVDPEANPCVDFFQFACGKYVKDSHGEIKSSPMYLLQNQLDNELDEMVKQPINEDDHYLVKMQKALVQGCLNETATELESLDILKQMLNDIGGWPVAVGHRWRESVFSWKRMVSELRQKGYPYLMMLKVGIASRQSPVNKIIVQIEPPSIYTYDIVNNSKNAYIAYMAEVAVLFGAKEDLAVVEMEKVLDFTERLKKVSDDYFFKTATITNETKTILNTVEEFQNLINETDWLEFINSILYPAVNISKNHYGMFPAISFMEPFLKLIYKTPKRTQANYIIWNVVNSLLPYLSKELRQIKAKYTLMSQGSFHLRDRFEFCKSEISELFLPQPTHILYIRKSLSKGKRKNIDKLLQSIKMEFITILQSSSWLDEESKARAVEKALAIVNVIGTIGSYTDDSVFEKIDDRVNKKKFRKQSFLKLLTIRRKEQSEYLYSKIHSLVDKNMKLLELYDYFTKVIAGYIADLNTIVLSTGILQGIFYNEERPMYLNYGSIGSIIGHELTHGFCKRASKYDKHGNLATMWTNITETNYLKKIQCVIQNTENFTVGNSKHKINGENTLEENVADYTGLMVSYRAYKRWVQKNGEEKNLPGVHYSPYQLFWISAVSYHCYRLNEKMAERMLAIDNHAPNIFRAIEPLRNNHDFARDFNCPLGSRMNPSQKCQVF